MKSFNLFTIAFILLASFSARAQMITIYQHENFAGASKSFPAGKYDLPDLGIGNDQLSSVKVPSGMKVTLYEHGNFQGRTLVLTKDTDANFMVANGFNDITSGIVVEQLPPAGPVVTIYQHNFSGASKSFSPGSYDLPELGIGNDQLSSVRVPNGMKVTLFEHGLNQGRSLVLTKDTDANAMVASGFNDITSGIIVEQLPIAEPMITIFRDNFSGPSKSFSIGNYDATEFGIGNDQLSSVKIPAGLMVTLFEHGQFQGRTLVLTSDASINVLLNNTFNDIASSMVVAVAGTPAVVIVPVVVPEVIPTVPVQTTNCEMTSKHYDDAVKAIDDKPFRDTKMSTAKLATKGKCLSLVQVRGIAELFSFEDQKLDFVKYAYELCSEKAEYYTLSDIFDFNTNVEDFNKFIESKQ